ncbi:MAG TPA: hypothetical protein VGP72_05290 [Planctomycetota bacterium]|jgi:hypothetical protein
MAAEAGGPSMAGGVSYQALAIARALLDVFVGRAEWVRVEAPEQSDFGRSDLVQVAVDDFVVCRKSSLEFYQAKSSAPGGGVWTVKKLAREGILEDFRTQTTGTSRATCILVTPSPCPLFGTVAERVRSSTTFSEFTGNLGKAHAEQFRQMYTQLKTDKKSCHRLLHRWHLDAVSDRSLAELIRQVVEGRFAHPSAAFECLVSFAVRAMQSRAKLDAEAIRRFFDSMGVFDAPKANIESLLGSVRTACAALRIAKKSINGVAIQREVVVKLAEWVLAPEGRVAVLLDRAGTGKTAALASLMETLDAKDCVVIGVKADALASFASAAELQDGLGLSDSIPSIASTLSVQGRKVVVMLDQVDALSAAMAHDSAGIKVLLGVVQQLQTLPGVKTILSCREFDWRYDDRLRSFRDSQATVFTVGLFSRTDVERILQTESLTLTNLHPAMDALLQTPIYLDAFVEMIHRERSQSVEWTPARAQVYTLQQLYERRWSATLRRARDSATDVAACDRAVGQLVDQMSARQELSIPDATVNATDLAAVEWLSSEGILARAQRCIRFFHQTFFDFMAARRFVGRGTLLTDYLLKTEQSLFYRPLVRQVLEHVRETDRGAYFRELPRLLAEPRIRKHIKAMVLTWLGQLANPSAEELSVFELLLSDGAGRIRALGYMKANAAWFDLLSPARFERWLATLPDHEIHTAIWFLRETIGTRQKEIEHLLRPYLGRSPEWNGRVGLCLSGIKDNWQDISVRLLRDVLADEASQPEWHWQHYALEDLAKFRPAEAAATIGVFLKRYVPEWLAFRSNAADEKSQGAQSRTAQGFLYDVHGLWEAVKHVVECAPGEFLEAVLQPILLAMEATCERRSGGYRHDHALWLHEKEEHVHDGWVRLLWAFANAAKVLAKDDPTRLRRLTTQMLNNEFEPMQQVVALTYASQGETFAPDAAAFLLRDLRRFKLGMLSDAVLRSATLIQACSHSWPPELFAKVESAICSMKPRHPKSTKEIAWHQEEVLELLSALDAPKLSENGKNLLGQLHRKFPETAPRSRVSIDAGFVGPPISPEGIKRMGDQAWLGAMRKYTGDWQPRTGKPIGLSGGRSELAQALQQRAKEDPERFFNLANEKMDSSFHVDYVAAIITGLSEAGAPIEHIEKLIDRFASAIDRECVREVSSAIGKYAEKPVPNSLAKLLENWALTASADKGCNSQDLVTDGLNTERGGALWNLGAILLKAEPPQRAAYLDVAEKVIPDASLGVRAVCIQFLTYAIPADPLRACEIFRRMVRSERELLRSGACADFVYRTTHKHSSETAWAVKAMLADAEDEKAREAGGRLACLAAFENPEMVGLRDMCLSGDAAMRKGAATVYAHNINSAKVGAECRSRLKSLWNDAEAPVRAAASEFLNRLTAENLRSSSTLLLDWTATPAFDEKELENASRILSDNALANAQLTLEMADRITKRASSDAASYQGGMLSFYLVPAIVAVYHDVPELRGRAMDLLEQMEEWGCSEVAAAYTAADRVN